MRTSSRRIEAKSRCDHDATAMFLVMQQVRFSKSKMKFSKSVEHNFSTEIFRVVQIMDRCQREVYELEDLNGAAKHVKFYQEELTPVCFTIRTTYKLEKVLYQRVKRDIRVYIVRWRGYCWDFDSWVPAYSLTNY